MKVIVIAQDFTDAPGGRLRSDGPHSGEQFRIELLEPYLDKGETVTVDLDGTFGYATSFLEEVFGGLSRKYGQELVLRCLRFKSDEDLDIIERVQSYIRGG